MRKCAILQWTLLLLCVLCSSISFAQERTVTGKVLDEKDAPLVGATVTVKETNKATSTDSRGNFSINVPQNAKTLIISFIGMQSQEISIENSSVVSVA